MSCSYWTGLCGGDWQYWPNTYRCPMSRSSPGPAPLSRPILPRSSHTREASPCPTSRPPGCPPCGSNTQPGPCSSPASHCRPLLSTRRCWPSRYSCLEHRVVGVCFWLFCTSYSCDVRPSVKVHHFTSMLDTLYDNVALGDRLLLPADGRGRGCHRRATGDRLCDGRCSSCCRRCSWRRWGGRGSRWGPAWKACSPEEVAAAKWQALKPAD